METGAYNPVAIRRDAIITTCISGVMLLATVGCLIGALVNWS